VRLCGIEVVVFDLDDTLYPERSFVRSGFRAVSDYLVQAGATRQDLFHTMWQRFCDGARGRIFNETLQDAGILPDEALIRRMIDIYRTHLPDIHPHPDALFALKNLHGRKRLGLITDGPAVSQRGKVRALGIEHYFDILVFTDELGRESWKPSPAGYKKIMDALKVKGEECLYVGDNPAKDFVGARALGWKTVRVRRKDGIYKVQGKIMAAQDAGIIFSDHYRLVALLG